jgi:pimeloyl-ACP methyl ester carboxylesterase
MADAERRMSSTSPGAACQILASLGGYDLGSATRRLACPLRAINGDIYPTDVEGVRKVKPDFDVAVMEHMGHYPMLERPDEFNRHVADVIRRLAPRGRILP